MRNGYIYIRKLDVCVRRSVSCHERNTIVSTSDESTRDGRQAPSTHQPMAHSGTVAQAANEGGDVIATCAGWRAYI